MGVAVTMDGVDGRAPRRRPNNPVASYEMVKTMRASTWPAAPWHAVAKPRFAAGWLRDWCASGRSAHQGLQAMGAEIKVEQGYVHARKPA